MGMQTSERNDGMWWIAGLAGAATLIIAVYYFWPRSEPPAPPATAALAPPEPAPAPAVAPPAEPVIEHPVEAVKPPEAAPQVALDGSDGTIAAALGHLLGNERMRKWFFGDAMVRRFVATVDNLSRPMVAMKVRSLRPVPGAFEVLRDGDAIIVSAGNAARYTTYVQALERVDTKQLAGVYLRFYPLFQQAYRELGYSNGHFNDRLVEAIEVALGTPPVEPPLRVVQPKVYYEFVDRSLETLPAAQKLMLRMGPENAAIVKARLVEIHAQLVRDAGGAVAAR